MKILLELIIFVLQPVFWLTLLRNYFVSKKRIQNTRQQFHNAIYPHHFELRQFWANLFIFGIIGSAITFFIGPVVTLSWLVIYQLLCLINLLLIPGMLFSVTIASSASILAILLNLNGYAGHLLPVQTINNYGFTMDDPAAFNYLLIGCLVILGLGMIIAKDGGKYNVPTIARNERQTRIAGYPFRSINVIPLLLFFPGDWLHSFFSFWPVFMLNGHSFSFLVVPMLLGFRMTVFKRLPRTLFKRMGLRFVQTALLGLILTIVSYFFPIVAAPAMGLLLLIVWWLLVHFKAVDRNQGDWYSETINGIRVVGIVPHTPAAKLKLAIGDVILEVNGRSVTNEDEFYHALLAQSTYCRMKVKNRNGRLVITETAIFNNAPHEIGVVLFKRES